MIKKKAAPEVAVRNGKDSDADIRFMLSQFTDRIAHEMRNPLAAAKGYIQLALQDAGNMGLTGSYLENAVEEIDNAVTIISNLLSLVESAKEDLKMADINDLLYDALQAVRNPADSVGVKMEIKLSRDIPNCLLDKEQVKRAFGNVLHNALQAMPQGGLLTVVTGYSLENEEICVSVADTGEGITGENLERVFNPFFSTRAEGLGLGLTLANRIVHSHNGRLVLESTVGKGTTVFLYFPAQLKTFAVLPGLDVGVSGLQQEGLNIIKRWVRGGSFHPGRRTSDGKDTWRLRCRCGYQVRY